MKPVLLLFCFSLLFTSCKTKNIIEQSPSGAKPFKHQVFSKVLNSYVRSDGMVNYADLAKDKEFQYYLERLKSSHPDLKTWNKNQRLAYWINAYNAFTLKLIIDNYPVKSIKDIPNQWSKEFINIEGSKYSLEQIEHDILRKIYKEPRIHFAINCASYSCPKMQKFAFEDDQLDAQLEIVSKEFVNDGLRNKIAKDKIELSKIFKWFKSDFTNTSSIQEYIQKYATTHIDKATKIEYLEYNWELNEFSP